MNKVEIKTPDGSAPTYVWDNKGPSVLFFMDGIGMRPAIRDVAAKVAAHGYRVVMPDLFYRLGEYTAPNAHDMFKNPAVGKEWWAKVVPMASMDNFTKDIAAYLDYMNVPKVGVTGYCMGGRLAIMAAEKFPDRIAAAAAYHPGGLVSDQPDSPHLHVGTIKAKVFIGAAKEDQSFTDEQQHTFDAALTKAGVDHQLVQFDAKHGWVPSDTPVHDEALAAKHFETLFALFASALTA
ncbi:MAG TPA: alpha/beta fold hydrolase [Kofleriaceae bacterium]|nr:alpha/beta fold hydrolase [Kofleriaceae bacterium]